MQRRWNLSVWAGFSIVLAAFISYPLLFSRFPVTRDVPWLNLSLFAAGLALVGIGLRRAFRQPDLYRGKVAGTILGILGAGILGLFSIGTLYYARLLPDSSG